jgi:hypothetical protein
LGFRLFDLGSYRVLSHSSLDRSGLVRIGSGYLISGHLGFHVVRVQVGSGSSQFDFLKKQVESDSAPDG